MINSIKYFEEECISKFEKLEDDFMKQLGQLAEYVFGLTEELHKLGLRMTKEKPDTFIYIPYASPRNQNPAKIGMV